MMADFGYFEKYKLYFQNPIAHQASVIKSGYKIDEG